jgi:hypothetical protein
MEKFDNKNELHLKIALLQKNILRENTSKYDEEMDKNFREYWFNGRGKKKSAKESQLALL